MGAIHLTQYIWGGKKDDINYDQDDDDAYDGDEDDDDDDDDDICFNTNLIKKIQNVFIC